jgi:hypothetical protein
VTREVRTVAADLRSGIRVAFGLGGLGLVAAGLLLAFREAGDLTSLGALLVGVLVVVAAATGRLPREVGLQRVTFGADDHDAEAYREALDLQVAVRSHVGERAAVVRWRSTDDNATLQSAARGLNTPNGPSP